MTFACSKNKGKLDSEKHLGHEWRMLRKEERRIAASNYNVTTFAEAPYKVQTLAEALQNDLSGGRQGF